MPDDGMRSFPVDLLEDIELSSARLSFTPYRGYKTGGGRRGFGLHMSCSARLEVFVACLDFRLRLGNG